MEFMQATTHHTASVDGTGMFRPPGRREKVTELSVPTMVYIKDKGLGSFSKFPERFC